MQKHHIILLWWNNPQSKNRIQGMHQHLAWNDTIHEFHYTHWEKKLPDIDFDQETKNLATYVENHAITNYSILAKSAGFILAVQSLANKYIAPKHIIWYGLPLEYCKYRKVDLSVLFNVISENTKILLVQADQDPQWNIDRVKDILSDTILIQEIKDNTHNYDNFEQMTDYAKNVICPSLKNSKK